MLPSLSDLDLSALSDDARRALPWAARVGDGDPVEDIARDEQLTVAEVQLALDRLGAECRRQTGLVEIPLLTEEEYDALRESIAAYGQLVPILASHDGKTIVDGRHRLRACNELRIAPRITKLAEGLDADQLHALALVVNLARRQVTTGARRGIIRNVLLRDPARSDRAIAVDVGVSHPTVAAVRRELEHAGEVESLSTRRGRDGKEQPVRKPKTPRQPDPTEVVEVEMAITTVQVPGELLAGEWVNCAAVRLVPNRPGFVLEIRS